LANPSFLVPPIEEPIDHQGGKATSTWWRYWHSVSQFLGGGGTIPLPDIAVLAIALPPQAAADRRSDELDKFSLARQGQLLGDPIARTVDVEKRALLPRAALDPIWGQIRAATGATDAIAGNIGEYVSSAVLVGAAVALASTTAANVTTIALTPGDWDVAGAVHFAGDVTTTVNQLAGGINTTSATLPTGPDALTEGGFSGAVVFNTSADETMPIQPTRLSLAAPATVYLVAKATFAVSTCVAYGILRARRVR
jgi:hypothetical protein